MQISRHWRMNAQRYRLQGYRHQNGAVSLQARPAEALADEHSNQEQPASDKQNKARESAVTAA